MKGRLLIVTAIALFAAGCMSNLYITKPVDYSPKVGTNPGHAGKGTPLQAAPGHELATFAGGDFREIEARFRELPGVTATAVGYTGGEVADPTFEEVRDGKTGHAEAVLVEFDPKKIGYEQLLETFFKIHDPTTKNRQGEDVGTAYRSAVFHHSIEQRNAAAAMIRRLAAETGKRIVTFVAPAEPFFLAEPSFQQAHAKAGSLPRPMPDWR
jgi:peptide-methionine (S)-S-oxide reductase